MKKKKKKENPKNPQHIFVLIPLKHFYTLFSLPVSFKSFLLS